MSKSPTFVHLRMVLKLLELRQDPEPIPLKCLAVGLALASMMDRTERCDPKRSELARASGGLSYRSVSSAVCELEQRGVLRRVPSLGGANEYILTLEPGCKAPLNQDAIPLEPKRNTPCADVQAPLHQDASRIFNQNNKTSSKKLKKKKMINEPINREKFESFKKAYPRDNKRRTNWTEAGDKWDQLMNDGVDPDEVIVAAQHYGQIENDPQYVMSAVRFMNKENWRRYLDPPKPDEVKHTQGGSQDGNKLVSDALLRSMEAAKAAMGGV